MYLLGAKMITSNLFTPASSMAYQSIEATDGNPLMDILISQKELTRTLLSHVLTELQKAEGCYLRDDCQTADYLTGRAFTFVHQSRIAFETSYPVVAQVLNTLSLRFDSVPLAIEDPFTFPVELDRFKSNVTDLLKTYSVGIQS